MVSRILGSLAVLTLTLSTSLSFADCLSKTQKKEFWTKIHQSDYLNEKIIYKGKSHSIYSDQLKPIIHSSGEVNLFSTGFATSNENHHFYVADKTSSTPADIHLGFGTTINFNIIGMRPGQIENGFEVPRTAIFSDLSPEIVASLIHFWRPLFLISETPAEFLGRIAEFPITQDTIIQDVFAFVRLVHEAKERQNQLRKNSSPNASDPELIQMNQARSKAFAETKILLQHHLAQGTLSENDYEFIVTVLEQEDEGCPLIYQYATMAYRNQTFAENLTRLYDPLTQENKMNERLAKSDSTSIYIPLLGSTTPSHTEIIQAKATLKELLYKSSFLLNPEHYKRVRNVFVNQKDFYAITDIRDNYYWMFVGQFAKEKSASVTDVYLSCIPGAIDTCPLTSKTNRTIEKYLDKIPGDTQFIYISTCQFSPPSIEVKKIQKSHLNTNSSMIIDSLNLHMNAENCANCHSCSTQKEHF
jgi:hypothetical protein